ncbi:hypothetical protein RJT34_30348 [Clitoria ternatea]|uniref:Uncharacterized protein n=1 Tax=Clitoria ternatea TaxID=43366 RepID=A0AAN9ET48_CLITE
MEALVKLQEDLATAQIETPDTATLSEGNDRLWEEVRVNLGIVAQVVKLYRIVALETFNAAICQVKHRNPSVEPDDVPFELTPLPPNQSMTPKETASQQESARGTSDNASGVGQKITPPL